MRTLAFAVLISAGLGSWVASAQEPYTILTYSDYLGSCNPQKDGSSNSNVAGCCGSPGWRECALSASGKAGSPGCTDPDQNKLRNNSYDSTVVCNLGGPYALPPPVVTTPNDATFYVMSDLHYNRPEFWFFAQSYFPGALNTFALSGRQWPVNAGIPAGDTVNRPVAAVIAGDMTTGGGVEELGEYRTVWEPTLTGTALYGASSFQFPVFPGLGNHDVVNAGSGGAGASSSAQRMWDYVKSTMSYFNMDNSSAGLLGVDDGQGTHNYSWNWQGVHYVQLNTWAGERNQYNAPIVSGLTWLKNDLAQNVGNSQTPVVLFQHYDLLSLGDGLGNPVLDSYENSYFQNWWAIPDYTNFWNVIRDYNVIGTFSGHVHTGWDMERPEHYTSFANGDSALFSLPSTDSKGNKKIYDVYRSAPAGGYCGTAGCTDADSDFYTARVSAEYLDVAAWYWNQANVIPQPVRQGAYPAFWGNGAGAAACRKRINTRYVDVSGLVSINDEGSNSFKIQNNSAFDISGQLAIEIQYNQGSTTNLGVLDNVTNRSFVDSCDAYFGNAYIILPATDLPPGGTLSQTVQTQNGTAGLTVKLIQLQPLGYENAILMDPTSLRVSGSAPQSQKVYYYAPVGVVPPFNTSITYSGGLSNWLSASFIPGVNGASGGYQLTFNSSILGKVASGIFDAQFTITSASGDSGTLNVSVVIKGGLVISPSVISFNSGQQQQVNVTSSNGAPLSFTVSPRPGFSVSPLQGTTPATLTLSVDKQQPLGGPGNYTQPLVLTADDATTAKALVNLSVEQVSLSATAPTVKIVVDNQGYEGATPPLLWVTGSEHYLEVPEQVVVNSSQELRWLNWSNNGAANQHVVTPAYGAPVQYLATYATYDRLSPFANPNGSGSAVLSPPSPDGFYPEGTSITVSAAPKTGYAFTGFSGAITASQSPQTIILDAPEQLTLNFSPINGAGQTTIASVPSGQQMLVDGVNYVSPASFYWDQGQTHSVTIQAQQLSPSSQVAFVRWTDGNTSATRQIAGIHGGTQTFTAQLGTEYLVNVTNSPANAGGISGGGFIGAGAGTTLTAIPASGFAFTGFTGDVVSSSNGVSVSVTKPFNIQANYTATQAPILFAVPGARSTVPFLDLVTLGLTLTNASSGPAGNAVITSIDGFTDVSGSGAAGTTVFTPLPVSVGTIFPGQSASTAITLVWPQSATRMQFRVHFAANGGAYIGETTLNVFR